MMIHANSGGHDNLALVRISQYRFRTVLIAFPASAVFSETKRKWGNLVARHSTSGNDRQKNTNVRREFRLVAGHWDRRQGRSAE
jgi:hypothetical protein